MRIALLVVLLSGCLTYQPIEPTTGYDEVTLAAEFEEVTSLDLGLLDFTDDSLALEIVTEPGSPVFVEVGVDLSETEGTSAAGQEVAAATPLPCLSIFSASYRAQVIGSLRSPGVFLSGEGQETEARFLDLGVRFSLELPFNVTSYSPGAAAPVAVALDGAAAWADAGGSVDVTLSSDRPFWYRLRDGGSLDCALLPTRGEGGTSIDLGTAIVVRDETFSVVADNSTIMGQFVGSDGGYDVDVRMPGQTLHWNHDAAGRYHWHWGSGLVPEGEHAFQIHELQGTNTPTGAPTTAAFIVHDVEPWVLLPPWQ